MDGLFPQKLRRCSMKKSLWRVCECCVVVSRRDPRAVQMLCCHGRLWLIWREYVETSL